MEGCIDSEGTFDTVGVMDGSIEIEMDGIIDSCLDGTVDGLDGG